MKTRNANAVCISLLMRIVMSVQHSHASAEFTYTIDNDEATITGHANPVGHLEIPERIEDYPVTGIGWYAFRSHRNLTGITIPSTVTRIEHEAFAHTGLIDLYLSDSVSAIENGAFSYCRSMTNISVDAANLFFSSLDGVLFDKNRSVLIQYPAGRTQNSYVVPESVLHIGFSAFATCSDLFSVTLAANTLTIGTYAFSGCRGITNVTIPDGVTNIGALSFNNSGLIHVEIPASVVEIGDRAFAACAGMTDISVDAANAFFSSRDGVLFNKALTELIQCPAGKSMRYVIPDGVSVIGPHAFRGCANLTSVTIPDGVIEIRAYAFDLCTGLTSLTIPASVASIGYCAFRGCGSLSAAYFSGNAPASGTEIFQWADNLTVYYLSGTTGWPEVPDPWHDRRTALWLPTITRAGMTSAPSAINLWGFWAPGQRVQIQTSSRLMNPDWTAVHDAMIDSSGIIEYMDSKAEDHPVRFYRVVGH